MKRKPKNTPQITINNSNPPGSSVELRLVIKVPEYGARFGVSPRTVWKWLAEGLPHMKLSNRNTQIPLAEADQWVREHFLRQRES
jgi:predicted DNA-binding transcriptional regulator AlpA